MSEIFNNLKKLSVVQSILGVPREKKELFPLPSLRGSDIDVVRASLSTLNEIFHNNQHDFFDGIVYLDTSARPLFYVVDSVLTKACLELNLSKPPQFFMLAYSSSIYNPDFGSSYYRLLDGRDAMKKRAKEILFFVKSPNPKLLVIDDYSCPPKRGTVKEVRKAFASCKPKAQIHFFAFMSGLEPDRRMPKIKDNFSFGTVDPNQAEEGNLYTNGFLYRGDKSRSSVGVWKPSGSYPYARVNSDADRKAMKSLRKELRNIGNRF